jgi:protein ImuB
LPLLAVPDPDGIQAVVEGVAGRQSVLSVTPAAQQLGVQVGLARAAAEIRVPQLIVYERRTDLEQHALRARARAAFAFTPFVSIEAPDTLLLEIQGSVQLFGGLETLLARAQQALSTALMPALYAVAPTVRAALWLARGRAGSCVTSVAELPSLLARLPLAVTGFDATVQATCERLGVTTLGELMRLPRDGVARRLSPEVPQRLDEALGRVSQPRRRHVLPERFMDSVDLPADGVSTAALQPWCERLLATQERFLVQRDSAVAQCRFRFKHRAGHTPSLLVLGRSWPSGSLGTRRARSSRRP